MHNILQIVAKLKTDHILYYEATNGVRFVLAADGMTVWTRINEIRSITDEEINFAVNEFLSQ